MSKDDFFNSLNDIQKEYVQFLIDVSYSNGYDQAIIDSIE